MFSKKEPKISSPIIHAIHDAVLLGNIKEIDGVLDLVKEDEDFPQDLRYALEAMLYFRFYYGKGCELEPLIDEEKIRVFQLEAVWGRELIESIGHNPDLGDIKYA